MDTINAYLTGLPVETKLFIMLTCIIILVISYKLSNKE